MHKGIKPHACHSCSYKSAFKKNLQVHERRHAAAAADKPRGSSAGLQEAPIIILVNLAGSAELEHMEEEEGVVVEVEAEQQEEEAMSPMSLLLSAAESSEGGVVVEELAAGGRYLSPDDAAAPLDLSVAAAAHGLSKNPENDFLEFTSVNSGRRRSVFLAEERDFETQADMTVVDPVKVTGVNG